MYVSSVERSSWGIYILTVSYIISKTSNFSLGDTPAYTCFGYDSSPNQARTELRDIYNYDSPESLITQRVKLSYEDKSVLKIEINNMCNFLE